ncbi:hypothetical protein Pfo_005111 [Paulownia fortunei]|nr:hypothetical protein Pfo_005111 [Paulownia fortunei]
MVLPYEPLSIVFQDVQYYVEPPKFSGNEESWFHSEITSNFIVISLGISGGVPKLKDDCNPATWMLEITSASSEAELGIGFSQIYVNSA